jgi:hypothetical protein
VWQMASSLLSCGGEACPAGVPQAMAVMLIRMDLTYYLWVRRNAVNPLVHRAYELIRASQVCSTPALSDALRPAMGLGDKMHHCAGALVDTGDQ